MMTITRSGCNLRCYWTSVVCFLTLIVADQVTAQTFTVLHTFNFISDGRFPESLKLSGNTLYGTASSINGSTVFAVNTNGTEFRTVTRVYVGIGGFGQAEGLIVSGNILYGAGGGQVFAVNSDGTGFTVLHSFTSTGNTGYPDNLYTNVDGLSPWYLILSGNTLYGIANRGGTSGNGTVFSITLPSSQLAIVPSQANVILTWPTNSGFTLQSTTNLGLPAVWTTNSPPPVVVNGQNTVTNHMLGKQKFYRLSQ